MHPVCPGAIQLLVEIGCGGSCGVHDGSMMTIRIQILHPMEVLAIGKNAASVIVSAAITETYNDCVCCAYNIHCRGMQRNEQV